MAGRGDVTPKLSVQRDIGAVNRRISGLAEGQEGNVARWQLLRLGVTDSQIATRLANGFLVQRWRGVYSVGPPRRTFRARCWAAVLAGGPGAVVSHLAAAVLWGIRQGEPGIIDVTAGTRRRPRAGIRFHLERLPPDEVTDEIGIPVTAAARTAFDAAGVLQPAQTESMLNEVEIRQLWSAVSIPDLLERHPRRRGGPVLRNVLEEERLGLTVTPGGLAEDFMAFLDEHGLPRPVTSTIIAGAAGDHECDCVWRRSRTNVELDSRRYHATSRRFETDRARDLSMEAAGWTVIRVTGKQLRVRPDLVLARLRQALGDEGR